MSIQILHRNDLPLGGFAGLKEHRLVTDPKLFGRYSQPNTWPGLGNFVYLADARFNPHGDTRMHDHQEIDVISIMMEGRIHHQGSLEDGQILNQGTVQVQRAGGEGFAHNEVNPDNVSNRMLQLWVLPEQKGQAADYKLYQLQSGEVTRIYGGSAQQNETFAAQTIIEVASLEAGQSYQLDSPSLAYMAKGQGLANQHPVEEGDLIKDSQLNIQAQSECQLVVIYQQ